MTLRILAWLGTHLLRLLRWSYRFNTLNMSRREKAHAHHPGRALIYACWHQNALAAILGHVKENICPLISQSKDGQLIAYACEKLGYHPVRGSSSRGGQLAKTQLVELGKKGSCCAITVDGPKGPRHETKPGIITIARDAKMAILPVTAIADRYWEFNSWDKFRLPKPFAKILINYGEPIVVGDDISARERIQEFTEIVNAGLNHIEQEVLAVQHGGG